MNFEKQTLTCSLHAEGEESPWTPEPKPDLGFLADVASILTTPTVELIPGLEAGTIGALSTGPMIRFSNTVYYEGIVLEFTLDRGEKVANLTIRLDPNRETIVPNLEVPQVEVDWPVPVPVPGRPA